MLIGPVKKVCDEMESADEMEIWGVRWRPQDGRVVPAFNSEYRMDLSTLLLCC